MAIAKVGKSGGAGGAVDYLLKEEKDSEKEGQKQPQMIGGNVAVFGTKKEVKDDFDFYSKLKPNVKNQAVHFSISLQLGEHLSADEKIEFSEKLLDKLDFQTDKIPYLIVEHHDKNYEHWHIVAGRIREDGTTVKEWKIAERAIAATKELETEFSLQPTEYKQSADRRTTRSEYKMMERTEELSVIAQAKLAIDESLKEKPNVQMFVADLQQAGFEVRPNVSCTTGKMNGFSFKKNEIVFKSSSIGRQYSFQNLQNRGLDYEQVRDKEYLIGVKENESTQKRLDENGRNQSVERNESPAESAAIADERATQGFTDKSGIIESGSEQSERAEPTAERAESVTQGTKSNAGSTQTEFDAGSRFSETAESHLEEFDRSNGGANSIIKGAESAESADAGAADADFGSSQFTNQDNYFDVQRSENGSQEIPIQQFDESGLLISSNGSIELTAKLAAEIGNRQIEVFNRQLGDGESQSQNSAAEISGNHRGIAVEQLTSQSFVNTNLETINDSSSNRINQIMADSSQNQNEIDTLISDLEKSDEDNIGRLDISFRMEEPQIDKVKQEAEIEEEEEVEVKEDFDLFEE